MLRIMILLCLHLSLIACNPNGNGLEIDDSDATNDKKELGAAFASGALEESQLEASSYQLQSDTTYSWSVRVENELGVGFWSNETLFTIFDTEAKALADAVARDDVWEFSNALYKDDIPIATIVPVSPAGSITLKTPQFTWLPSSDANTYRFRLINTTTNEIVIEESVPANSICTSNSCAVIVESGEDDAGTSDFESITTVSADNSALAQELSPAVTPTLSGAVGSPSESESVVDSSAIEVSETLSGNEALQSEELPEPTAEIVPEPEPTPQAAPESLLTPEIVTEPTQAPDVAPEALLTPEVVTEPTPESGIFSPTIELENPTPAPESIPEPDVIDTPSSFPTPESSAEQEVIAKIQSQQQAEGLLAFPGAIGFSKNTAGGRGGRVVVVNTVQDIVDANDNLTSLREAFEVETGPRNIVFEVGGLFDTSNSGLTLSGENASFVTVACQTAPSPGVVIKTHGINIQDSAHDVVFRHCRVRGVDVGYPGSTAGRSFTVRGGSNNIMLDHMSLSWATDEGFQVYLDSSQQVGVENVTLSHSIVAEGDADSSHALSASHANWGYHAMGPSCNNNNATFRPTNCSIVNNFIAHNSSRNAMIWGGAGEIANNIIYNWYCVGVTARPQSGSDADVIVSNNLMKSGPDTEGGTSNPDCGIADYRCALFLGKSSSAGAARYSVGNNYYIPEYEDLEDAVLMTRHANADSPDGVPAFDANTSTPVSILELAAEGSSHMNCMGASKPFRDAIDNRVIQEFYAGTGAIGIGENVRNGSHNTTTQRTFNIYGSTTGHAANYDADQDGMADSWEALMGLNSSNGEDHSGDLDNDGYTNLEEFMAFMANCE